MPFDLTTAQPAGPQMAPTVPEKPAGFDLNSARPLGLPDETVFVEKTGQVLGMPSGTVSRIGEIVSRGWNKGDATTELSKLHFEQFLGNENQDISDGIKALQAEGNINIPTDGWLEEMVRATSQQLPILLDIASNSADRAMQGGIIFGTAGLAVAGIGAVPGFLGGVTAGATTGLIEQTFILETGNLYGEISQFTDDKGNKIDPLAARIAAAIGGAANAGLEAIPYALMFKLVPGSEAVFKKLGNKASEALDIPSLTKSGALKRFAFNIAKIIAVETATEGAQETIAIAAGESVKVLAEGNFPRTTALKAVERVADSVVEALKATPLIGFGVSTPRLVVDLASKPYIEGDTSTENMIKGVQNEVVDSINNKIRQTPISEDLDSFAVPLEQSEVNALSAIGIELNDDGSMSAKHAELVVAEGMRRSDSFKRYLSQAKKKLAKEESAVEAKVRRARVKKLDTDISNLDSKIDDAVTLRNERNENGKPTKVIENRVNKLLKLREVLDEERSNIMTAERPAEALRQALRSAEQTVELKGAELIKAQKRIAKITERKLQEGIRKGISLAKKDMKAAQASVIKVISEAGIPLSDKGRFLAIVKKIQTAEQFQTAMPVLLNTINKVLSNNRRKKALSKLKSILKASKTKGNVGKFTPEIQTILDSARLALGRSRESASEILEGRMTGTTEAPSMQEAFENRILSIAADPNGINPNIVEKILESVAGIADLGKQARLAKLNKRKAAADGLRAELFELMGDERSGETDAGRRRREAFAAIEVNTFLHMSGAWWNKLKRIMQSSDAVRVEALVDKLTLFQESRNFERGKAASVKRFTELAMIAIGAKSERSLLKRLMRDETDNLNMGSFVHSDGTTRLLDVKTRAQLRKRVMEFRDPALRASMKHEDSNAYTEEIITELEAQLTEEDVRLINAQLQFYEEFYDRINETYQAVYGITLPKIEFYSPIKRVTEKEVQDEFMKGIIYRGGVSPSSLKARKSNLHVIAVQGDMEVLMSHIIEMEYFIAYSEKVQQLNEVFDAKTKARIERMYGASMLGAIRNDLDMFAKKGVATAAIGGKLFSTLMRNFTFAQLGAKPQIGLKQLASFTAYADGVSSVDFVKGLVEFSANPMKALRILNESELFSSRGMNIDRDFQAITSDKSFFNFLGKHPTLTKVLMIPIRLGDKGAIAIGGYARYSALMKKNGGDKKAALASVEKVTIRTQQSNDIDQISALQNESGYVRVLSQFMSSANAITRAEYDAIIDGISGRANKRELAKRLLIYHVIIPNTIQFIANGFTWDDEDQLQATILGALNGWFIVGDIIEGSYRVLTRDDGQFFDLGIRHPLSFFNDIFLAANDFQKNGIRFEDFLDGSTAIDRAARGVSGGMGVPLATMLNEARGVGELFNARDSDDVKEGVALMLGFSPYTIDNKILAP